MTNCWIHEKDDSGTLARAGQLVARDGTLLPTPLFQPVATAASLKTLDWRDVEALGFKHVLMNTYHLVVRPGVPAIEAAGGLKAFSGWHGSILTDSGGYQVHSLAARRSLKEDGVRFADHIEGSRWHFSPEFTLRAQLAFGVDFAMPLDVCTSLPAGDNRTRRDLELTHKWAAEQVLLWPRLLAEVRAREEGTRDSGLGTRKDKDAEQKKTGRAVRDHSGSSPSPQSRVPNPSSSSSSPNPSSLVPSPSLPRPSSLVPRLFLNSPRLFGIVQGGLSEAMRRESAEFIAAQGFDGLAIGGLSVGESRDDFQRLTAHTTPLLPADKVRYLMGVGEPGDMLFAIAQGIDMFDCVQPTRIARHGTVYTRRGKLNLKLARFTGDLRPLDEGCRCPACRSCSRAYLRHLVTLQEHSFARLLTIHNLAFYGWLMKEARRRILAGTYAKWWQKQAEIYDSPLPEGL